jgi:uncharacterized cupredoxin-like copper-binding protein
MDHVSRTAGARVLSVAVAALLLGACSSTSATTATPSTTSPSAASPASPASAGTTVDVTEKEFSITLSQTSFTAGAYTFKINNTGSFPHNLAIEGPGVDKQKSSTFGGGQSGSLTVTLQKGTYELSCAVPGHKDKGMDMKITVT